MLKYAFKSLSRGFLYTIGRILAFMFIGLVVATIVSKLGVS